MMKNISRSTGLSRVYTNHCVRVTVVTELKEQGFSNDEIASLTGHKSSVSLSPEKKRLGEEKIVRCLQSRSHLNEKDMQWR